MKGCLKRWIVNKLGVDAATKQAGRALGKAGKKAERRHQVETAIRLAEYIKRPDLADKLESIRDE